MFLPKVDSQKRKVAQKGVKRMIEDSPNSATRGVYSIYGDFPKDIKLNNNYFERIYAN